MKKLTRNSLDELAQRMPVLSEELQHSFIGGGNGTRDNPYTETEFNSIIGSGSWYGGYVESWGYVAMETSVTPSGSYTPGGGVFVSAADVLYESNANAKSGFWGDIAEGLTGIGNGTNTVLDAVNTFLGDSNIAEYFKENPNTKLYKTQKTYQGNTGITVYQDSYYDANGQLIGVRTYR